MKIWVDADGCPNPVKEILYRAAERLAIPLILVANRPIRVPRSTHIRTVQVPGGFDAADERIVEQVEPGDLVITGDIPLAAQVLARGAHAMDTRGGLFSEDTIQERLTMRSVLEQLRGGGVVTGGPSSYGPSDRLAFANQLDRFLSRRARP